MPAGWGDPGQQIPGFSPDSFAADLQDTDDFTDNINVILSPAGEVTADQVESLGVGELESVGAVDVEVRDRVSISGRESAHLSAVMSAQGTEYQVDQFYLTNGGQTFVVTFSFSTTVSESDRDDITQSVLASWTWE